MKYLVNFSLAIFAFFSVSSQAIGQNKIKWMTWEEAMVAHAELPKKIVVDIYTDWCMWCKRMDKQTFQKDHIARYVNKHYYAVKFDAEQKEDIEFNGMTYKFIKKGRKGYHELAAAITQGQLSYPTVVFLDENLSVIQPIPGFQDAQMFELIMTYFSDNHYKNTPWVVYTREYKSEIKTHTVSHK